MNTKLTLRLDDALIHRAKLHASRSGRSLSKLVADYFTLMEDVADTSGITPRVRSLLGSLDPGSASREDYWAHLERKHQ
jgi:hypothetical protein